VSKQKQQGEGENPYHLFVTRQHAFHEAGHVVVGHSLGWRLIHAKVSRKDSHVRFDPPEVLSPRLALSMREQARGITDRRNRITVTSAGQLAMTRHQREVESRGYSCRQERRAYTTWRRWPLSTSYPLLQDKDPASDDSLVVYAAEEICFAQDYPRGSWVAAAFDNLLHRKPGEPVVEPGITNKNERVLGEIVRGERRAERILERHWGVVSEVAAALEASPGGRLDGEELLELLAPHVCAGAGRASRRSAVS
jgi:hypothetical protein